MSGALDGKTCIVTGAGRGLGREFALALAAAGAAVVVNDVGASLSGDGADQGPAEQVVAEIESAGGRALASLESVADPEAAQRIVAAAIDGFGRLDGVINNAGIVRDRMFFNMSLEEWQAVIDVNLNGAFHVARAAAPHFREQRAGAYLHVTSTSGLIGNVGQANYSASKIGLTALSKTIALDMGRYGVRSNCIAPFAWTRMTSSVPTDTPEQRARVEKLKLMEGSLVAPLAVHLLSDDAQDINGQIFCVRAHEIFMMGQSRPLRSVHTDQGWTPETIAAHAIPALRSAFYPLDVSADVFSWDPV